MTARRFLTLGWPVLPLVLLVALPFNGLNGVYLDPFDFTFTYAAWSVGWHITGAFTGYISLANLGLFGPRPLAGGRVGAPTWNPKWIGSFAPSAFQAAL